MYLGLNEIPMIPNILRLDSPSKHLWNFFSLLIRDWVDLHTRADLFPHTDIEKGPAKSIQALFIGSSFLQSIHAVFLPCPGDLYCWHNCMSSQKVLSFVSSPSTRIFSSHLPGSYLVLNVQQSKTRRPPSIKIWTLGAIPTFSGLLVKIFPD